MLPLRRENGLLIRELPDELLVYDLERFQAHCLNAVAALVWRSCDGKTTIEALSQRVRETFRAPAPDQLVLLALRELHQAQLLNLPHNFSTDLARYSRRDLLRRLGAAAALVPAVMTILAPAASAAGSDTCTGTFGMCMHRNCPSGLACRNLHPSGNECGCV